MKKILLIDDSEDTRCLVRDALEARSFVSLSAADGVEGVALAERELPDLVLCDVRMPKLDGFGVLAAMRRNAATAGIPFVFLTAVSEKVEVRRGMDLGADDYLTKPFTVEELIAAIQARLDKHARLKRHAERQLDELRGNLSLALPHEFLTPLNSILGFSAVLIGSAEAIDRETIREHAEQIHAAAQRLRRLTENFLIYAQLEVLALDPEAPAPMQESAAPVGEVVAGAARERAEQHRRPADLVLEITEGQLTVPADKLVKIVTELVDNAFKFSPTWTPVLCRVQHGAGVWELTVKNCGRGMSAEQIALIGAHMQFERTLYEQQGAGLGLILARRLVEYFGGRISIESAPGEWTEVRVQFRIS